MSALTAGEPEPLGFKWIQVLSERFSSSQKEYILLLHGSCLYFGLQNSAYEARFNTTNPQLTFLQNLHSAGVQIRICELCLQNEGFQNSDLLPFVQPVAFSIDYLINEQIENDAVVIYDSPIPPSTGYGSY